MQKSSRFLVVALLTCAVTAAQAQQMSEGDSHSPYIASVVEYRPAPGQFINKMPAATADDTPATMAQKCTECLAGNARVIVSLGAWGGSIIFKFDHSIANIAGERDLYIMGNALQSEVYPGIKGGSAEPGIVMVSKDVNGNGLPDDPWYELSGSADADSAGHVAYGYAVTYRRQAMQDVPWTDNRGGSGVVNRNEYNTQEYFPLWLPDELSFEGTRLPDNAVDMTGKGRYWFQYALREGYVDNLPNADREGCSFDLAWAVDEERKPVNLDFIDFVRVYTGVQQMCGWIGETSTEVQGAEDLHLDASINAIREATAAISQLRHEGRTPLRFYSPGGTLLSSPQRGLNIVVFSDGTVEKQQF